MMLGFLLARAGVDTIVLEKHADFLRDFRGDTIHPSTLEAMHELGLLEDFLKLPHQEVRVAEGKIGNVTIQMVDFSHLPTHAKFVALMPQWDFLDFLAERAKRYPCFRLERSVEVDGLIEEEGGVAGVLAKTKDGQLRIRADLTIGADGRHSFVRREAGFVPLDIGAPMDVLWLKLSRQTKDAGALLFRADADQIREYWQCAYVIAKGSADRLKAQGIGSLRGKIAALAPFLAGRVAGLESFDDVKLLTVAVDRLPLWHKLLCIGDAAHAMSPIGGVGINLALRLFIYFPVLRRLPARLMGLGVRRERVISPAFAGRAADHPD
jgi:2-polyprenyl-6-methoxyphenol hydroxylase-like FAD-dependent oxidoreductase